MKRREFIKSMAAAAALPGFLGEMVLKEPEFKNLRAQLHWSEDIQGVTGFTWNCVDGQGGVVHFRPEDFVIRDPAGSGSLFELQVTVNWSHPPMPVIGEEIILDIFDRVPETSIIKLWKGEVLIYQIMTPGAVEMVFFHPLISHELVGYENSHELVGYEDEEPLQDYQDAEAQDWPYKA